MNFNCPYCSSTLEADDTHGGLVTECPFCHQEFAIPKSEPQVVPVAEEPNEVAADPIGQPVGESADSNVLSTAHHATAEVVLGATRPDSRPSGRPVKVGQGTGGKQLATGCLATPLFRGVTFLDRCYYLAGVGEYQKAVFPRLGEAMKARGPEDLKIRHAQAQARLGGAPRDVLVAKWSIGHAYVVCFAPGTDLFVSVRVNFVPGCLARALHLFRSVEPNIFGVDDLNMLFYCATQTVEGVLDSMQLSYLTRGTTA